MPLLLMGDEIPVKEPAFGLMEGVAGSLIGGDG
jgi:hypothetical protein